jgi:hypothetical protein
VDPDAGGYLVIFLLGKGRPQGQEERLDPVQGLPRVLELGEIVSREGVRQVK